MKDYVEMTRLRDAQLKTLEKAAGIMGPFGAGNQNAIRLLNALGSNNLAVAYAAEGVALPVDTALQSADLKVVFGNRPVLPPVRVKLNASATGVGIQFSDTQGKSREFWAYQGQLKQTNSLDAPFPVRQPPHSELQADGSYIPPFLAGP